MGRRRAIAPRSTHARAPHRGAQNNRRADSSSNAGSSGRNEFWVKSPETLNTPRGARLTIVRQAPEAKKRKTAALCAIAHMAQVRSAFKILTVTTRAKMPSRRATKARHEALVRIVWS